MEQTVGFLASLVSFILFVPQAFLVYKKRGDSEALAGCSVGTNLLLALNAVLWCVYGFLTGAFWVAAHTQFSYCCGYDLSRPEITKIK